MQYQDRTDRENLTGDEAAVSRLLGELRRVEAPPDFDFKLKARITNYSPVRAQPSRLVPLMKFAVPLCLLLFLVSGFFVLNGTFTSDTANAPASTAPPAETGQNQTTAGNSTEIRPSVSEPAVTEFAPAQPAVVERAAVTPKERSRPRPRTAAAENTGGGVIQRDLTISQNTIRPLVSPTPEAANTSEAQTRTETGSGRNAAKLLSSIGVDSDFAGGELKVLSVRKGSAADNAGLMAGDVVKAIGSKAVSEGAVFDSEFKARSLSVVRAGKTVIIALEDK